MPKKENTTQKKAAPAISQAAATPPAVIVKPDAKAPENKTAAVAAKAPAKASKPKASTKPKTSRAKAKAVAEPAIGAAPAFSNDDIALRAYYLGEKRQKLGLPGDSAQDWLEAERQLTAEAKLARKSAKSR